MSNAVVRDAIVLLALALIASGCARLFGVAVASVVLGTLLLLITLRAGAQRPEK